MKIEKIGILELKQDLSTIPTEVKIIPLGNVSSTKGAFYVDELSLELILKQIDERGLDVVVDYEHQTLDNVQAPAAGWIKKDNSLSIDENAIVAKIEWTHRAEEYLANKEYKYLSPVVLIDEKKHVIGLHSVALTNTPAINGMFALVNKDSSFIENEQKEEQKQMDLNLLIKLLDLPADATSEMVQEVIEKLVETVKELSEKDIEIVANKTVLSLLGLTDKAKTDDVAAAILSIKQVPADVETELKTLKDKMLKDEAEKLVLKALDEGKISSAQKEWASVYALKDSKGFTSFMEKAPKIVMMEAIQLDLKVPTKREEIDMKICKQLGLSKEDIEKYGGNK